MRFLSILPLLLALTAHQANAHTFFTAAPTLNGAVVDFVGYTHTGSFFYNFTTAAPAGVASAALVVGNPAAGNTVTAVTLDAPQKTSAPLLLTVTAEGEEIDPPATGYFAPEAIAAGAVQTAAYGGVYDLMQLACKGELFLEVKAAGGDTAAAPLTYLAPDHGDTHGPMKTCEEAAQPYRAPAPAPAPTPTPTPTPSASVRAAASVGLAALAPLAALAALL